MFKNKYITFNIVLVLACSLMAQEDEKIVREIVLARFKRLHNLILNYKVTTEFHLPPGFDPQNAIKRLGSQVMIIDTGNRVETKEFSVLENRTLYDQHLDSWNRKIEHPDLDIVAFTERKVDAYNPDRTEHLHVTKGVRTPRGEIRNDRTLPRGDIDIALGLRRNHSPVLLTEELIKEMAIDQPNSDQVILRDVDAKGITHEWIFDRKLGYALTSYRTRIPPDNWIDVEFVMEEFKNVDGIFLPFRISGMDRTSSNGRKRLVQEYDIQVAEYRLNDPTNTPERYRIKWPEGTRVYDMRSGFYFFVKGGQMTYVNDEDIFEMALDEISKAEVNEPNTSAPSHDTDEQDEDLNAVEDEPTNLPVGDIVPPKEPQKLSSRFWWAGVFAMAVFFVSLFVYRKHKVCHSKKRNQIHQRGRGI